jgi:hypothetical protein
MANMLKSLAAEKRSSGILNSASVVASVGVYDVSVVFPAAVDHAIYDVLDLMFCSVVLCCSLVWQAYLYC